MQNEIYKKKIRSVAKVSAAVLTVYILLPLYACVKNFCAGFAAGFNSTDGTEEVAFLEWFALFFQIMAVLAGVFAIVNSLQLLFGMRKGETPFDLANGKRIRLTGIMLMLIEPLLLLSKLVAGEELHGVYGITFGAGLIMYNVSLLFDYGAHLQQESDETL